MTITPTLDQIKRGIAIAEQIEALKSELDGILGKSSAPAAKTTTIAKPAPAQGKFKRSPETIAKMKAAQQARWAQVKAPAPAKTEAPAKKGGMSAAGKAKIAAAQKARWAKIKAAKAPVDSKAPAKEKGNISTETKRWTYTKAGK